MCIRDRSNGATAVSESGTTDTLTVVLDTQPITNVVVSVSGSDSSEAILSTTTIIFTTSNWDTPQTITVTGVDDQIIDGNRIAYITISIIDELSSDEYDYVPSQSFLAIVYDDDRGSYSVYETNNSTIVSEAGKTDSFSVVLNKKPASNVVFRIVSQDTEEGTVSTSSLTFSPSNWDVPQSVTVTGVNDGLDDGDQSVNIVLSADGFENVAVGVVNADNDGGPSIDVSSSSGDVSDGCPAPLEAEVEEEEEEVEEEELAPACVVGFGSVVESSGSTVMSEGGSSDSFTFALASQPGSSVVVSVKSSDLSEASVSTSSLTFSPSNWDVPQGVTVTGVNDGLDDGNQTFKVTISVVDSSSDGAYALLANQQVSVTNLDNEEEEEEEEEEEVEEEEELAPACVVGFGSVVESSGSTVMSESGSSDSFTFALASQPGSSVVVSVKSSDLSEASVSTSSLTFSPSNWDAPQGVTVTGVNDGLDDGDQSVNIVLSADGFQDVLVRATNIDNE